MTAGDGAVSTVEAPDDVSVGGDSSDVGVGAEASDEVGVGGEAALAGLRRQAQHLIAELAGPVRRIRLRSGPAVLEVEWHPDDAPRPDGPGAPTSALVPAPSAAPAVIRPPVPGRAAVRAPIVGTFYRASEPGARPFVAVGDLVRPGQPVAIVEAMKLMNEVTADRAGRVAAILVEDGQPVEYDQPLVELDPA
ncbi:acetyl-CoA carboxylase biotin carboxyl carrier protein [Micromonospora violae]|uniref:Biotin carboxyl carrier protein of acetyl-CoA carboxylase n=1 Tax=Micromonospora violae TaxID=1278207 RepID=A0A4Q7UBD8_9ACTN|nr:biotin/lipoyl-containing protein [Micromonospora violae]RZT78425.1 acetyl-CoA carboxylase biotin carboxyl carrier protein [Micromonospora violae]